MPALAAIIDELFDVQFLNDRFRPGPEQSPVAGVILSGADFIALKSAVMLDARQTCLHLDCNPKDQAVRAHVSSALANAWNASPVRMDLRLPAWPWQ